MAAVLQTAEKMIKKHQVVFMVDLLCASSSEFDQVDFEKYSTTVRLTVLKLLNFFGSKRETTESLKWGYKFMYTRVPKYERCIRCSFKDFNLRTFKEFECEVASRVDEIVTPKTTECGDSKKSGSFKRNGRPVNTVKTTLTEVTQDFEWDLPDISSPTRKKPITRTKQRDGKDDQQGNYVFVLSPCPRSGSALQTFSGHPKDGTTSKGLKELLMSNSLYSQFHDVHNIKLYWIDTGEWCLQKSVGHPEDFAGYSVLSKVLEEHLDGRIIPVNALLHTGRTLTTNIQSVRSIQNIQSAEAEGGNVETREVNENDCETELPQNNRKTRKICAWIDGPLPLSSVAEYYTTSLDGATHSVHFHDDVVVLLSRMTESVRQIYCKLELLPLSSQATSRLRNLQSGNTSSKTGNASTGGSQQIGVVEVDMASSLSTEKGQVLSVDVLEETDCDTVTVQHMYVCGVVPNHVISIDMCDRQNVYGCIGLNYEDNERGGDGDGTSGSSQQPECASTEEKSISAWFQNLQCLLAQQQLALVVEFYNTSTGLPVTAVLQPLTFTMATLRIIQPDKILSLEKNLVFGFRKSSKDDVTQTVTTQTLEPWYPSHPSYGACQKLIQELINIPVTDEEEVSAPVSSLMQDIQELYWREKQAGRNEKDPIREVQSVIDEKKEDKKKSNLKKTFRRTKSMNLIRGELMVDKSKEVVNKQTQKGHENNEEGEKKLAESQARRQAVEKEISDGFKFSCEDDLLSCLQEKYNSCLEEGKQGTPVCQVAQKLVYTAVNYFRGKSEENYQMEAREMLSKVILSDKELRKKYADKDGENAKREKKREIMMQVLLRVEVEIYTPCEEDQSDVLDDIHVLLGMLNLMFPGEKVDLFFLKEDLLENYLYVCPKLLCAIYEELMQPLPPELHPFSENRDEEEDGHDISKDLASCQSAGSLGSLDSQDIHKPRTRSMSRHFSFADAAVKKQIVIPVKPVVKKEEKTKLGAASSGKKQRKQKDSKKEEVKKVRRNLFTDEEEQSPVACKTERRNSVAVMQRLRRPTTPRKSASQHVLKTKRVSETPKWKQSSSAMLMKLDRARKRSQTATEVAFVKESPVKSGKTTAASKSTKGDRLLSPRTYIKALRRRNSFYSASDQPSTSKHQHALELRKSREFADRLAGRTVVSPQQSQLTLKSPTRQSDDTRPASFLLCEIFSPGSLKRVRKVAMKEDELDSPSKNTRSQVTMTPTKVNRGLADESMEDASAGGSIEEGRKRGAVTPGKGFASPKCILRGNAAVATDSKNEISEVVADSPPTHKVALSEKFNTAHLAERQNFGICKNPELNPTKSRKVATSLVHRFKDSDKETGDCETAESAKKENLTSPRRSSLRHHFSAATSPTMTTRSSSRSPSAIQACPTCSPSYRSPSPTNAGKLKMKTPESLDKWPRRKRSSTKSHVSPATDRRTPPPTCNVSRDEKLSPMGSPIFGKRKRNSKSDSCTSGSDATLSPSEDPNKKLEGLNAAGCIAKKTATQTNPCLGGNSQETSSTGQKYLTRSKSKELDKSPTSCVGQENVGTPRARKRLREASPECSPPVVMRNPDFKYLCRMEGWRPSPKRSKSVTCPSNPGAAIATTSSPDPVNTHITFASPVDGNSHVRFTRWSSPAARSSLDSAVAHNNSDYFSSDNDEVFLGNHAAAAASRKSSCSKFSPVQLSAHGLSTLLNSPISTGVPSSRQRCVSERVIRDKQNHPAVHRKQQDGEDFVIKKRK